MVDTLLNPAECPERGLAPSAVPVPFLSSEHQAGNSSQVTKKVGRVGQVHSFCRFVGCGRVFEAHQFQSGRATEHRKRSWPGWSSWPSSLFGSVLQMSKSAKLANIDQIHSSYIFVGCGRVFEAHQFQFWRASEHHKRSWPGWSSWPTSLFRSVFTGIEVGQVGHHLPDPFVLHFCRVRSSLRVPPKQSKKLKIQRLLNRS